MGDLIDRDGFRANVGIVLMNDAARVFIARRVGGRGWQFPQGGMRRGEGAEEALFRELREEVGLRPRDVRVVAQTRRWLRYRLPARYIRADAAVRCIGQKQRWFLLQLTGEESAIHFDATDKPEFDRWKWVDYWQPVREVIYFKRSVYTRALQELGTAAFPEGVPAVPRWWRQESSPAKPE